MRMIYKTAAMACQEISSFCFAKEKVLLKRKGRCP
jgi:hypothetical protein